MLMATNTYRVESTGDSRSCIIIVDDDLFTQDCLRDVLRREFDNAAFIGLQSHETIDVSYTKLVRLVIFNAGLLAIDHPALLRALARVGYACPKTPIVLIARHEEEVSFDKLLACGVKGFIPSSAPLAIAMAAFRLVMAGGTYLPSQMRSKHASTLVSQPLSQPTSQSMAACASLAPTQHDPDKPVFRSAACFTAREAQVLEALQKGYSNKWIASDLKLSENTVKVHIRHIMRKLKATNRTQAALIARKISSSGLEGIETY